MDHAQRQAVMVVVKGENPKFAFEMLAAGILWGKKVQYIVRHMHWQPLWIRQNN
jgi:hypothetical protein